MLYIVANVEREEPAHDSVVGLAKRRPPDDSPFWTSRQPVLWLAAHNLVADPDTYYRDVAQRLGMEFVAELPVMMDDSASVANIIGPSALTRLSFFVYRDERHNGGRVVVACACQESSSM